METSLVQKAIHHALNREWIEAIEMNLQILKENTNDIDALNRLARAYAENGDLISAKNTTESALKIDPNNSIAVKCLLKYKNSKSIGTKKVSDFLNHESFLEDSGKTKLVELINLGNKQILNSLSTGDQVKIVAYSHKVSILTDTGKYVGCLPDDLSARLKNLIKVGGKYHALLKSVGGESVTVFIRETLNKTKNLSFPPDKLDYVTFTPPELVHKNDTVPEKEDFN